MNPVDYFPQGYTPRAQQVEAIGLIEDAFARGAKAVVLEAPPGVGKTHIGMTLANLEEASGGQTFFLSSLKILQDQYLSLFPEPALVTLKGRNAYSCDHPDAKALKLTADEGVCRKSARSILPDCVTGVPIQAIFSGDAAPSQTLCAYWKQVLKARWAKTALFNLHSFLYQKRLGRFGRRTLMIADEAHNLEQAILGFVDQRIWESDLKDIKAHIDDCKTGKDVEEWMSKYDLLKRVEKAIDAIKPGEGEELPERIRKDLDSLEHLAFKLDLMAHLLPKSDQWAVTIEVGTYGKHKGDKALVCRPVYANTFAHDLFFKHSDRLLAMSATILDHELWATSLGLSTQDVAFVKLPSPFPKEHRPIVLSYAGSMSYRNKDATYPRLFDKIREILAKHRGQRGIIHCQSYDLGQRICLNLANPRLMLVPAEEDKSEAIKRHASRPDSVLVSPGMTEGVDLKDDLSRFQIFPKVPYPSTQDLVIALRMKDQPAWYGWRTALIFLQACGRSVRSETDYATTYVLDSDFEAFYARNRKLFPEWFRESLVRQLPGQKI